MPLEESSNSREIGYSTSRDSERIDSTQVVVSAATGFPGNLTRVGGKAVSFSILRILKRGVGMSWRYPGMKITRAIVPRRGFAKRSNPGHLSYSLTYCFCIPLFPPCLRVSNSSEKRTRFRPNRAWRNIMIDRFSAQNDTSAQTLQPATFAKQPVRQAFRSFLSLRTEICDTSLVLRCSRRAAATESATSHNESLVGLTSLGETSHDQNSPRTKPEAASRLYFD